MKSLYKKLLLSCVVVASMFMFTLPADAHVSVDPDEAPKGSFSTLTFKVPNEEAAANTVKLELILPEDAPIGYVNIQPKVGWSYEVEKKTLDEPLKLYGSEITEVISKITFSGGEIKPGEFDDFKISVGPLPEKSDTFVIKALQTYDDGNVVRWIDESVKGEEEPEHPAPTINLVKGDSAEDSHGSSTESTEKADTKTDDDQDTLIGVGVGVAVGALVLSLIALIIAVKKRK